MCPIFTAISAGSFPDHTESIGFAMTDDALCLVENRLATKKGGRTRKCFGRTAIGTSHPAIVLNPCSWWKRPGKIQKSYLEDALSPRKASVSGKYTV